MKRFRDALDIQSACNPSGVANAIVRALHEAREAPGYAGTQSLCDDPAVKLMVFQLAYLCGVTSGVQDMHKGTYLECSNACVDAARQHEGKEAL